MLIRSLAILLCLIAPLAAEEPWRWRFAEGDRRKLTIEQEMTLETSIAGKTETNAIDTGADLHWRVLSVSTEGTAEIEQSYVALRYKMQFPNPKLPAVTYDSSLSTKPTGDAKVLADELAPLLSLKAKFTLSPRGEIGAVKLDEALATALEKQLKSRGLQAFATSEGVSRLLSGALPLLPEKEVKSGDEWESKRERTTLLGAIEQTTNFRFLGEDSDLPGALRVECRSTYGKPDAKTAGAVEIKKMEQRGYYAFDPARGRIASAESTQEITTLSRRKDTPVEVKLVTRTKFRLGEIKSE